MPNNVTLKAMNAIHKTVLLVSGGRAGWNVGNMPVIKLTTTGRISGQQREVMLTCPVVENDTYVVVASRGGDDIHPAWFLNLRDNPVVWVQGPEGPKHERRARIGSAEERAALWPRITSSYKGYAGYQQKTDREIPIVFLERV